MATYKLKAGVDFKSVNKKSINQFDFDLSDYYNEKTRIFKFPKGYLAFHWMGEVFINYLLPLDLVEDIEESDK